MVHQSSTCKNMFMFWSSCSLQDHTMICKKYTCVLDQSGGMISLHMSPFFLGTHHPCDQSGRLHEVSAWKSERTPPIVWIHGLIDDSLLKKTTPWKTGLTIRVAPRSYLRPVSQEQSISHFHSFWTNAAPLVFLNTPSRRHRSNCNSFGIKIIWKILEVDFQTNSLRGLRLRSGWICIDLSWARCWIITAWH